MVEPFPAPSRPTLLSVVIVNYRSWPDVERLVAALMASPAVASGASEILVVDNASGGPVPGSLLRASEGLRLLLRAENDGFSAGVNAGWRASSGRWVLVLNPDVEVEADLIDRVLGRISEYEGRTEGAPGVVGFALRNPDGSNQPSVGAFPGLLRTAWEQLIPRSRRKYQPEWRLRPGLVDWVTGACMLLNGRMLADLDGMDEDFFLYYEEVALCRSASRLGWRVEFDPKVSVVHLRPLQNRPISPKMRVVTRHSKLLYFRKHLPAWQFSALGATVRLEARLREALCRARGRAREARSWRAVDRVAKLLGAGADLRGPAVRVMAEAVDEPAEEAEGLDHPAARADVGPMHERSQGTRPIPQPWKGRTLMKTPSHVARIVLLMIGASGLVGWIAANATIMSTDGLRYIAQAKDLEAGHTFQALFRSIDHPAYPLAISAIHRVLGGETPVDWQRAAQVASVIAGGLLVVPLYLVALEMFGATSAWLAVLLTFLVPITGHVMADVLSESLFLLFFFSGVWASIRFLKEGRFAWLPPTILFVALAYWVRPDALLLPVALVATLGVIPLLRSTRLLWPRWWAAVAFLVIGPACLMAPILATKGGLATKPAVMRVLGLGPKSAVSAVERQRPLDPEQTEARTYVLAARSMAMAVRDSVTIPLLPLALLGAHPVLAARGTGTTLGLPHAFDVGVDARPDPAPCHGGLLHAQACDDPLLHPHRLGRIWPGTIDLFDRDPRPLDRPARWPLQAWPGRLGRGPGRAGDRLQARDRGPDQQSVRRLSLCRGLHRGERPARSEGRRPDRLVPLLWEPVRVHLRQPDRGDGRSGSLQGRRQGRPPDGEVGVLPATPGADRRPQAGRHLPEHPEGKQSLVFIYDWSKEPKRTAQGTPGETR